MNKSKVGRPTDSIKDTMIRVRFNKEMVEKLDECVSELNSNRSEVIRSGIDKVYESLEKNK